MMNAVTGAVNAHAPPVRSGEAHGLRDMSRRRCAYDDLRAMHDRKIEAGDFAVVSRLFGLQSGTVQS